MEIDSRNIAAMTRTQIEAAIETGQPFKVKMADGKEYLVPHQDYLLLPPKAAHIVIANDEGTVYVLPLLTMAGLEYQAPGVTA